MAIEQLQAAVVALPYNLREQVLGYARSVDAAAPEIAREAGVVLTLYVRDQLAFIAGVRKLYAITASSYWAVDNAAQFLEQQDVAAVRVGRTDYSRGGQMHSGLRSTLEDFDRVVVQYDLRSNIDAPYVDVVRRLANES